MTPPGPSASTGMRDWMRNAACRLAKRQSVEKRGGAAHVGPAFDWMSKEALRRWQPVSAELRLAFFSGLVDGSMEVAISMRRCGCRTAVAAVAQEAAARDEVAGLRLERMLECSDSRGQLQSVCKRLARPAAACAFRVAYLTPRRLATR